MVVITLSECPSSLKGDLSKWLLEINPGVYVGNINPRVRENLWDRICESIKTGKATMAFSARNEQHLGFMVHNAEWEPIDFDGIKLVLRPSPARAKSKSKLKLGYSNARKYRTAKRMAKRNME